MRRNMPYPWVGIAIRSSWLASAYSRITLPGSPTSTTYVRSRCGSSASPNDRYGGECLRRPRRRRMPGDKTYRDRHKAAVAAGSRELASPLLHTCEPWNERRERLRDSARRSQPGKEFAETLAWRQIQITCGTLCELRHLGGAYRRFYATPRCLRLRCLMTD
jgi:hypothetical protein